MGNTMDDYKQLELAAAYHDCMIGKVLPQVIVASGRAILDRRPELAVTHGVVADKVYCIHRRPDGKYELVESSL